MPCFIYSTLRKQTTPTAKTIGKKTDEILFALKKQKSTISVHLIGDKRMRNLNKAYRGKDRTTDVLTFSAQEGDMPFESNDLGDVFISLAQIKRQAKEYEVPFVQELYRMLAHGILHALGYDHMTKKDAAIMFPLQEKLVKKICPKRAI